MRLVVSMPKHCLFSKANIRKFFSYSRIYGVPNAFRLAVRKLREPNVFRQINSTPLSLPDLVISCHEENLPLIDKKVSVVIPVKNAGGDFRHLLKKLKVQRGIRECEIIVVDSGSVDETLQVATNEGARVVEIPPNSFDHAYSRNKGAELATGDYVLFMVQDALPLTDKWLWEMARTLEQNDVVAVSCAEYPRSDCDLFYQCIIWNHYRSLNLDKDRVLAWDESCSSHLGLRSNSQIIDIAALIRRDVFNKYGFKTKFAEDLDLGIRLIKDGHKIGFLYSTRILHSHNRPAFYFLKRAYVDARFLKERFPNVGPPGVINQECLFRDIAALYSRTIQVASAIVTTQATEEVGSFMDRIKAMYSIDQDPIEGQCGVAPDDELNAFVHKITSNIGVRSFPYNCKENILLPHFLYHLGVLEIYVTQSRKTVDEFLARELADALYKLVALHSGTHLAYLYAGLTDRRSVGSSLAEFDRMLTVGI